MLKIAVILCVLGVFVAILSHRFNQTVRASYWPIMCLLKSCPNGANTLSVAMALQVPPEVAYGVLKQLHHQGYATYRDGAEDQPYWRLYQLTAAGAALIERNKWNLHQMKIYPT